MPDDKGTPAPPAADPKPEPSLDVKQDSIPYPRFKEVNDKLKALEEKERERAEAEKTAKEDALIAGKKHEEVITSLRSENERLKKVETESQERDKVLRESALGKITDDKLRAIGEKLPTPELLMFADYNTEQSGSPANPKGKPADPKDSLAPVKGESPQAYADRMRREYKRAR